VRAVVERAPLLAAMSRLMGVVERRNTIPILGNVVVTAEPGVLKLRATNLEMEATEAFAAAIDDLGEVTVPADKLHEIVRNADAGAQITLATSATDPRVQVSSGRSRFNLPALPAIDHPRFAVEGLGDPWSFPAKTLADMLSRVGFLRGAQDPITRLSATLIITNATELHVVACCNAGIALRREPAPAGAQIELMVLPKFTNQLIRWLGDAEGDAVISSSASLMRVEAGGATLTSKVLDDVRVDYLRALLEEHPHRAIADQAELSMALRRVMVMGEQKIRVTRFGVSDDGITLAARDGVSGEGVDEIGTQYEGPPVKFEINADIVQGALANLKGDLVELGFVETYDIKVNDTGKVVVRAPSDPGFICNLMRQMAA
jgi:DNA polymerase-3 subunit beta